jgi:hypothetical protein
MRSIIIRGVFAAAAALTVACSSTDSVGPAGPLASARRTIAPGGGGITTIGRTIDQYVWFSCGNGGAGEAIRVTGQLRYDVQSTKDSAGVYHFSIKSNTIGITGVGLTSGAFFRGLMTERVNSRAEDALNEDVRIADIIRFVAPGSGESFSLMATTRFIVKDGEYVLYDQTWSEVCR